MKIQKEIGQNAFEFKDVVHGVTFVSAITILGVILITLLFGQGTLKDALEIIAVMYVFVALPVALLLWLPSFSRIRKIKKYDNKVLVTVTGYEDTEKYKDGIVVLCDEKDREYRIDETNPIQYDKDATYEQYPIGSQFIHYSDESDPTICYLEEISK